MKILLVFLLLAVTKSGFAFEWQSLWQTSDQRGMTLFKQGKLEEAGKVFDSSDWRGISQYRTNNFEQAIESFGQSEAAEAHYNRANALARSGKLQEALDAYDEQLALGKNEDARFNRELVEKLMKQQSQSQSSDSGDKNQDNKNQNKESKEDNKQGKSDNKNQKNDEQKNPSDEAENSNNGEKNKQSDGEVKEGEQQPPEKKSVQKNSKEKQDETEQSAAQQADEPKENQENSETKLSTGNTKNISEDEQAMQQWLNRIPDDPSDLLRRKLRLKHQMEYAETGDGEKPW